MLTVPKCIPGDRSPITAGWWVTLAGGCYVSISPSSYAGTLFCRSLNVYVCVSCVGRALLREETDTGDRRGSTVVTGCPARVRCELRAK